VAALVACNAGPDEGHAGDGGSNSHPGDAGTDGPSDGPSDGGSAAPGLVAPPVDPTIASDVYASTAFLYSGADPIQVGVAPGTIDAIRAGVVRGAVFAADGITPLPGVTVAIAGHPELGHTQTRADGMFDLAVNAGSTLSVTYEMAGLLPVQRRVAARWHDWVRAGDVVMIAKDAAVTAIDLTQSTVQVHRATIANDGNGMRQATLLFLPGTAATMTMPDGTTQPLTSGNVRATEYTVGDAGPHAMPAELPPNTGYTYAVDYSFDEADAAGATVSFSQPVVSYLENFLQMPVGSPVPVGYLDRATGAWLAEPNGVVVSVLDVVGGAARLDVDGSGTPASAAALAALGVTDAELQAVATLYAPGQSLWRFRASHFSGRDVNWGTRTRQVTTGSPGTGPKVPAECYEGGSRIACESQSLGESVRVIGTPFDLHYESDRATSSSATVHIPLSGATVPPDLIRIDLTVDVAGEHFARSFSPLPDQNYDYTWDGLDAYGRRIQGQQEVVVSVGYVYPTQYLLPAAAPGENAGALFGSPSYTGASATAPVAGSRTETVSDAWAGFIGSVDGRADGFGGWTLSPHHTYDAQGYTVTLGDGDTQSAQALGHVITTAVGNGGFGYSGDGGPATAATLRLGSPLGNTGGVAVGPDGTLYIGDPYDGVIRRVSSSGVIDTIHTSALTVGGTDLDVGPDGSLYVADLYDNVVERIDPAGTVTVVAGNGTRTAPQPSDDGLPATSVPLGPYGPYCVRVGRDGSLYIGGNALIRRVTPDGIIHTIAGDYSYGYAGDHGPATAATLFGPIALALAPDGSIVLFDTTGGGSATIVRRITPDGVIETIAGGPAATSTAEGIPATQAAITAYVDSGFGALAVDAVGNVYVNDSYRNRIRVIGTDGIITTVAGSGNGGFGGDLGPAVGGELYEPGPLALAPDGTLYITDLGNARIRHITQPLPGYGTNDVLIASRDGNEVYHFDNLGRHLETLDAFTGAQRERFGYDAAGYLTSVTDGDGNVTTIARDADEHPTMVVAPGGQTTTLSLDAHGQLAAITDPAGNVVRMTSDAGGLLQTLTDARGNVHSFTYDAEGRLTSDANPAGGKKTLVRTESANAFTVTVTSALGKVTSYEADVRPSGALHRAITDARGAVTDDVLGSDGTDTRTYPDGTLETSVRGPDPRFGMQVPIIVSRTITTPAGRKESAQWSRTVTLADPANPLTLQTLTDVYTTPAGTLTATFDATARTYTRTSPTGHVAITHVDAQGRPLDVAIDASLAHTSYSYDATGELTAAARGTQALSLAYDSARRLASVTDATAATTQRTYASGDRLSTFARPDGETYDLDYDATGNLADVEMPSHASHAFAHTEVDRVSGYTAPDGAASSYVYDADGALAQLALASGRTIAFGVDAGGRPTGRSYPEAAITFHYSDATDRIASETVTPVSGAAQTIAYSYDGSLVTGAAFSGAATGSFTYSYDASFLLSGMALTSGADHVSIPIDHDADGHVTGLGPFTIARTGPAGAASSISDGTMTLAYGLEPEGRIASRTASVAGTTVYSLQLAYDAAGELTQAIETEGGTSHTLGYAYDPDGQLVAVTRDGAAAEQYAYDGNGNITSRQLGAGAPETTSYDSRDRVVERGAVAYTFDVDGFLATRGADTFAYSTHGELLHAVVGGATISYAYDALGRRVSRSDAAGTAQYLYGAPDAPFRVTQSRDAAGVLTTYYYDDGGILIALSRGGAMYYAGADAVGTPRVIADATGAIVKVIDYDAFGNVLTDSNPSFQLAIGYAGGLADPTTGLVRFGYRDYDPAVGHWTAADPALFQGGGPNLYAYVDNSPAMHGDPDGLGAQVTVKGSGEGLYGEGSLIHTDQGTAVCGGVGVSNEKGATETVGATDELPATSINAELRGRVHFTPWASLEVSFRQDGIMCESWRFVTKRTAKAEAHLGPLTVDVFHPKEWKLDAADGVKSTKLYKEAQEATGGETVKALDFEVTAVGQYCQRLAK